MNSYSPVANLLAPIALLTASRRAIFSNEKMRLARASMRTREAQLPRTPFAQQGRMERLVWHAVPLAMRVCLVVPFPCPIGFVATTLWKEMEELPAAAPGAAGARRKSLARAWA